MDGFWTGSIDAGFRFTDTEIMHVEVREAVGSDGEAMAAVEASGVATLRETYRPNRDAIAHKQSIADLLTRLVVVEDGNVVGTVEYSFESDRLHFLSLFVHSGYRPPGSCQANRSCLDRHRQGCPCQSPVKLHGQGRRVCGKSGELWGNWATNYALLHVALLRLNRQRVEARLFSNV